MYFGQRKPRSGRSSGERVSGAWRYASTRSPPSARAKSGSPLCRKENGLTAAKTRVGVEIESAGNETRQRSARDISAHQAKDGTDHTKQGLHHGPRHRRHHVRHHFAGVDIGPDLPVLPRSGRSFGCDRTGLQQEHPAIPLRPLDILRRPKRDVLSGGRDRTGFRELQTKAARFAGEASTRPVRFSTTIRSG